VTATSNAPQSMWSRIFKGWPETKLGKLEMKWGLLFLSPWLLGLLLLYLLPMVISLLMSFTNYDPVNPREWSMVGFKNYQKMLSDPEIAKSIIVTLKFGLIAIPLRIIAPLLIAQMVNSKNLQGRTIFRILFYLPAMIPVIAAGLVFTRLFNPTYGWINLIFGSFGLEGPNWFGDPKVIVWGLVLLSLWSIGPTMIGDIAALQTVPTELYEAAKVDGANAFYQFFRITLPLITNVLFFQIVLGFIFMLQYFEVAYVIGDGRGNPDGATLFYNLVLYRNGWVFNNMGYAASMAWVLFLFAIVVTVLLFRTQRYWVYYASERD
jgi:multiple sugar transport system permease protein